MYSFKLETKLIDAARNDNDAFILENIDVLQYNIHKCPSLMYIAVEANSAKVVELLIEYDLYETDYNLNYYIKNASAFGYTDTVKVLLTSSSTSPEADSNISLKLAIKNSYNDVVKLLLSDKRVIFESLENDSDFHKSEEARACVKTIVKDLQSSLKIEGICEKEIYKANKKIKKLKNVLETESLSIFSADIDDIFDGRSNPGLGLI